jgi:hypothetical protein
MCQRIEWHLSNVNITLLLASIFFGMRSLESR